MSERVFKEAAEAMHEGLSEAYQLAGKLLIPLDTDPEHEALLDLLAGLLAEWDSVAGGWVDH